MVVVAARRLVLLDSAETLGDLAVLPSNRLEALRSDRADRYGIRIDAQWRVCFRWTDDGPHDVEIVDDRGCRCCLCLRVSFRPSPQLTPSRPPRAVQIRCM